MTTLLGPPPFTGMLGTPLSLKSRVILAYHGPFPPPPPPTPPTPPVVPPPRPPAGGGGFGQGSFQPPLICPPCGSGRWRDPRCPPCPPDAPEPSPEIEARSDAPKVRIDLPKPAEQEPQAAPPAPEPQDEEPDEAEAPTEPAIDPKKRVSTAGNEEAKIAEQNAILLEQNELLRTIAARMGQVADQTAQPEAGASKEKLEDVMARWFDAQARSTEASLALGAQPQPLAPVATMPSWILPAAITAGILGTLFGVVMLVDAMSRRREREETPRRPARRPSEPRPNPTRSRAPSVEPKQPKKTKPSRRKRRVR